MADTLSVWMDTYKTLFAQRGIFPSEKDVVDKVFGDWNGPKKLGVTDLQEYTDELVREVARRVATVPLHPSVRQVVEMLHRLGLKLAVVTTSKKETVIPAIEFHRLREFIDVFLGAEDVVKHKPNPEIIEKALSALGGKTAESVILHGLKPMASFLRQAPLDLAPASAGTEYSA